MVGDAWFVRQQRQRLEAGRGLPAIQLLLETPSYQRLYHLSAPFHPTRAEYYTRMAEKLGLNQPHFICSEQDPQRIIIGDKICEDLAFVYQYPDPYSMLPKGEKCG